MSQSADYTNFEHIADIYKKYETIADGFMVSGTTALSAIEHHVGEFKKPVVSFHVRYDFLLSTLL